MERALSWLLALGYPRSGVDWLRRHRLSVIIVLALLAWLLFLGIGWALLNVFS